MGTVALEIMSITVINTHVNATIEVCAKKKIIHSGKYDR